MNTKSKQKFDYKKIETHSLIIRKILKRKKNNNSRLVKDLIKKNHLKNQQKMIFENFVNELMKKK